jgi:hypothetical protein
MKRYFALFSIMLLLPFLMNAQDLADALRYSQIQVQGTARSGAMGNAFGALGGDFTSVSINPAGLGLYRSSEFAITPISMQTNTESSYWGTKTQGSDYKFSLNNISFVSTIPTRNRSEAGIVNINIGIGYNRLKDFNSNTIYQGQNVDGSYMDYMADNANAGIWSDYYEELAWGTDMLLLDENTNEYWSDLEDAGYGETQRKNTSKSGAINEYSLAFGINFNHKLYLGASVGITDIYYRESTQLMEKDDNNNIPFFNEFMFNSYLKTYGYGSNFKFGAIYKPINEIRLGVSVQTPTFYNLHDVFETSMQSSITYDDGGTENYYEESPYSNYDYRLRTPFLATFSGAFVIAKKGLISIDYDYINYANAELYNGGDGYSFTDENMEIDEAYKSTGNLRIGGEYRVSNAFSLRAGYQMQGSAYNSQAFGAAQPNADSNINIYSGGIGYKSGLFFFDLAYQYAVQDNYDLPYPTPVSTYYPAPQMADINTVRQNVLFTFGYKF